MNNFITVFKKELIDVFRDKKSILFTLILPIVLYPLMFGFINNSMEKSQKELEKEINIAIEGNLNSPVVEVIKKSPTIKLPEVSDTSKALKEGDIQVVVKIPDDFDSKLVAGEVSNIEILVDDGSQKSLMASEMIISILNSYKDSIVEGKLVEAGINPSILTPFSTTTKSGVSADGEEVNPVASMLLGMLPTFIIVFMMSSTVGMAADLGAAEKERSTFEPLLSTSARRTSLLWGKISSMCVVSFISLVANMGAMAFSMNKFMNPGGDMPISLTPASISLIFIIAVLVLISLCALQMSISLYARTSKEANTYLGGLMMPVMLLAYLPMMTDANNINALFFNLPIVNSVCLMKELMGGIFNTSHIVIVIGWHIVYIVGAILFAKFMFSREEVVFRN